MAKVKAALAYLELSCAIGKIVCEGGQKILILLSKIR